MVGSMENVGVKRDCLCANKDSEGSSICALKDSSWREIAKRMACTSR